MESLAIKASVAAHFRYDRQNPLIAFEASDGLSAWGGEPADVLVVNERRFLIEIEVKVSIQDLKRDQKKRKHQFFASQSYYKPFPVNRFFFAVPQELTGKALDIIESTYPYAGLLTVNGSFVYHQKEARLLHSARLTNRQIYELARQQSGTLCRLARDLAESQQQASKALEQVASLRKEVELQKAINSTKI